MQNVDLKHITLPMQLVGRIANILNNLPYIQVAPVLTELTVEVQRQSQTAGQKPKIPVGGDDAQRDEGQTPPGSA